MMALFIMFMSCFLSVPPFGFTLQAGDLIFQESCKDGGVGQEIKAVTSSAESYAFTHVGIVYVDSCGTYYVLEATHPVVTLTPLEEFLYPFDMEGCTPRSVVGRLREPYRHCIPDALSKGLTLLGKKYDDGYILGNDEYYCSELVYEILKQANDGIPVFPLNTMTFKSAETGTFTPGWINYFKRLNLLIPEGEPGINPGAMSRSDVLELIYSVPSTKKGRSKD